LQENGEPEYFIRRKGTILLQENGEPECYKNTSVPKF
jgi:hypothetical protein